MKSIAALKLCPFCDGPATQPVCYKAGGSNPQWEISCAVFCVTIKSRSRATVIEQWNTRAGYKPDGTPTPGKRAELEASNHEDAT